MIALKILISAVLFINFLFLSGIHIYWGAGGRWGIDVAIPTNENNEKVMSPGPFECFVVGAGLLISGIFILRKTGAISFYMPDWPLKYGLWIITALFLIRAVGDFRYIGFFRKIKATPFGKMDAKYYSPLCLLTGLLGIILALIN